MKKLSTFLVYVLMATIISVGTQNAISKQMSLAQLPNGYKKDEIMENYRALKFNKTNTREAAPFEDVLSHVESNNTVSKIDKNFTNLKDLEDAYAAEAELLSSDKRFSKWNDAVSIQGVVYKEPHCAITNFELWNKTADSLYIWVGTLGASSPMTLTQALNTPGVVPLRGVKLERRESKVDEWLKGVSLKSGQRLVGSLDKLFGFVPERDGTLTLEVKIFSSPLPGSSLGNRVYSGYLTYHAFNDGPTKGGLYLSVKKEGDSYIVYPQSGPKRGLKGVTESGCPLTPGVQKVVLK